MSFSRLTLLVLPVALGLPMLTGACGAPVAVAVVSYGVDGVSLAESGKTGTDHLASMVSKKDCALWRAFRGAAICHAQDSTNPNPYNVSYDEPSRQVGEGGVEYAPPLRAEPNAPAQSWDVAAYKPAMPEPARPATTGVAETAPTPAVEPAPVPEPLPVKARPKPKKIAKAVIIKKPSPSQVASSR